MSSTTGPENGRSNRLTIREVADLAGVSTATVSRVINGRAEVSERARATVLRVVREHGYSTNRTARGLSAGPAMEPPSIRGPPRGPGRRERLGARRRGATFQTFRKWSARRPTAARRRARPTPEGFGPREEGMERHREAV